MKFKQLVEFPVTKTGNHDIYHSLAIAIAILLLSRSITTSEFDDEEIVTSDREMIVLG